MQQLLVLLKKEREQIQQSTNSSTKYVSLLRSLLYEKNKTKQVYIGTYIWENVPKFIPMEQSLE